MVSAKERLRELVDGLSEERAEEALGRLDRLADGEGEGEAAAALERRMGPRSISGREFRAQPARSWQEIVAEQGVGPVQDFEDLLGDGGPDDESVDEMVATIRQWRREGGHA